LLTVSPHDRSRRFQPDADRAAFIDVGALGGDPSDDILGGQYRHRRHLAATLVATDVLLSVKRSIASELFVNGRTAIDDLSGSGSTDEAVAEGVYTAAPVSRTR
jgi:hypothetical protein